jgi:hypothetical protein
MVGMIHFAFIPAVSLIAVIVIELYVSGIDEKDKEEMEVKYNEEERNIKEKIEKAQSSYDNLHCLITYIAHSRVRILI